MISTIPVWIIFISSILKIEKTNVFQIIGVFLSLTGVILSLLGVLFIITKSDLDVIKNLAFNRGDLIMASGMFAWALYSALLKKKNLRNFPNNFVRSSNYNRINFFNSHLFIRNDFW